MSQVKLEQLFRRCDTQGKGYIDHNEFRELCAGFEITPTDADVIFTDLDHDGDNKINFQDFCFGFRDFLTPGVRRGSIQLGLNRPPVHRVANHLANHTPPTIEELEEKQKRMEINHNRAQQAWKHFTDHISQDDMKKLLTLSGDKIVTLYEELQATEMPPHLLEQFEDTISALMSDVKQIEIENKKMLDRINKERESHTAHLKSIEAELDAQVARIEHQARQKAKQEYELEKKELENKMETELAQLSTQLKLFQKVDTWLNKEKDENHSKETQKKLISAIEENRSLKMSFNETQTNIALLRSELNQIKSQYENKCSELNEERENKLEYIYEFDNLNRQLELLREANQKLQDTNDGLRSVVNHTSFRSPRLNPKRQELNSIFVESKSCLDFGRLSPLGHSAGHYSHSDNGGSLFECDSLHSRASSSLRRSKAEDPEDIDDEPSSFNVHRLLDDIDSGNSTLPLEDISEYQTTMSSSPDTLPDATWPIGYGSHREGSGPTLSPKDNRFGSETMSKPVITPRQKAPIPAPRKHVHHAASAGVSGKSITARDLEPTGPPDRTYKVVFAGDAAVGKTSFINRITKGVFQGNLSSTLGVDFQVKTIRVDERNIALQLWDTAGQERFRSVTRSYFRRADGVMLLYDVTNEKSFLSVRHWVQAIDDVAEKRIPIMMCGNKTDLNRCVSTEMGDKVAREYGAIFLETSSKSGENVVESIIQLSRDMCSCEDSEVQTSALNLKKDEPKKGNCCSSTK